MRKWTLSLVAMGLFSLTATLPTFAQAATEKPADTTGNNGNNGNNRGGRRGNFDPAQMRQQYLDRIKQQLGATDEEWTAIQPKLQKLMDVQRENRGDRGGFSRGGRRGGDQGGATPAAPQADAAAQSEVSKASQELRKALENKETPAAEIDAKLKTLRDAKEKSKGSLTQAQKELKEILSHRQEAVLVNMGMLD